MGQSGSVQGGQKLSVHKRLLLQWKWECEAYHWHQHNHEDAVFHVLIVTQVPNHSVRPSKGFTPIS